MAEQRLKEIIFINQTLAMGGAETFHSQLLKYLDAHGLKVKAWTTNNEFRKVLTDCSLENYKIPIVVDIVGDWKGFLKGLFLILPAFLYYGWLVFKNMGGSVFLLTGYIEKILVTPWAKLTRTPVIWVEHGPNGPIFSKFFGIPGLLYKAVKNEPDVIITPSEFTKISNKIDARVIPDGIFSLVTTTSFAKEFSAFCVSRLEPGKGQDLLISSWPKVLEKFPSAKLYIIGTGDFKKYLQNLVADFKLTKSIIFTGWIKNLTKEIAPMTVGVFPSIWNLEGFGVVLLETMSLSKPVICFDAPPYNEVVDQSSAIFVNKGDTVKLSEAIIRVFSNPNLARKLGANGKKRFEKFFTIERCAQRYIQTIYSLNKVLSQNRFQVYLYDIKYKGLYKFISDRIKKRKFLRRFYYLFTKDYVVVDHKKLFIDVMDTVISEKLMNEGVWEPGTTTVFKKYAKKSNLIVDIGANIGYYTLLASGCVREGGRVVAFEPSTVNFSLLQQTIRENKIKNVILVKKAVGAEEGKKNLYSGNDNFGDRRLYKTSSGDSTQIVNVIKLDRYFAGMKGPIDLLKIDIEGYEVKAFRGAKRLLAGNNIKVIISELHPGSLKLAGNNISEYINILNNSGFNLFNIDDATGSVSKFSLTDTLQEYRNDPTLTVNILAINKK